MARSKRTSKTPGSSSAKQPDSTGNPAEAQAPGSKAEKSAAPDKKKTPGQTPAASSAKPAAEKGSETSAGSSGPAARGKASATVGATAGGRTKKAAQDAAAESGPGEKSAGGAAGTSDKAAPESARAETSGPGFVMSESADPATRSKGKPLAEADTGAEAKPGTIEGRLGDAPGSRDAQASQGSDAERAEASGPADAGNHGGALTPVPAPDTAGQEPPTRRRGGFLPLFLGGVAAAAIGYGLAVWLTPDTSLDRQEIASLRSDLGTLSQRSDVLAQENAALAQRIDQLSGDSQTAGADISARINALDTRVREIEQRPINDTTGEVRAALRDYQTALEELRGRFEEQLAQQATADQNRDLRLDGLGAELSALTARLDERLAQAEQLANEANTAEAEAQVQAALNALGTALVEGAPFEEELSALSDMTQVEIPQALRAAAPEGVATLAALQQSFADDARNALREGVKAQAGSAPLDRLGAFLRTQTGARSLKPREGGDPDAVLSRAEQALRDGSVDQALEELQALPPESQAELSDWSARAERRRDVLLAFDEVSASLNSN